MIAIVAVVPAFLLLIAFMAYAACSVIVQTRDVTPEMPGPGDGGGGPATDGPIGGGGPGLDLETLWTPQDDVEVYLLLNGELQH